MDQWIFEWNRTKSKILPAKTTPLDHAKSISLDKTTKKPTYLKKINSNCITIAFAILQNGNQREMAR